MRTHRAKTAHLPAEYYPHTFFDSYTLPFLRRFIVGAAIEKNFFWFYFSDFVLEFYFFQNPNFNSLSFTRYSLSAFIFSRFILVWFWFRIYFISFTIFDSDYNLGFCVFDSIFRLVFTRWILLASISTYFSIADSMF